MLGKLLQVHLLSYETYETYVSSKLLFAKVDPCKVSHFFRETKMDRFFQNNNFYYYEIWSYISVYHEPNFDIIKFLIISFYVSGILTSIKKENDEKSEEGTDITMSFPSGHDSDGLHYRVQGTFTRWVI